MRVERWRTCVSLGSMAMANLVRFRLRTSVVLLCLLSAAVPLLTALAIQEGLKAQALAMLDAGPDLLVAGDDFGRPSAVPLSWIETVCEVPGVVKVVPRAVGRVLIEDLPAVLAGVGPAAGTGGDTAATQWPLGRPGGLPELQQGQLAVGSAIAGHYGIAAGDDLQIALPVEGPELFRYRTFHVTVLLDDPQIPVWSAGLILGRLGDVQEIFLSRGMVSELMIWCRSGYEDRISEELVRRLGHGVKIQDRKMMEGYFHGGYDRRGGAFLIYFMAALVISIPVLAISSGLGLSARRREVAVMKTIGWETHEILVLQMLESVLTAVAGASLAVIIALIWLNIGSAWPLNSFLMPGAEELPFFRIPFHLRWTPVLLVYVFSISVTACGALASAWRAASVDPGKLLLGGEG